MLRLVLDDGAKPELRHLHMPSQAGAAFDGDHPDRFC